MSDATKNSLVAEPDDDRRTVADGDNLVGVVRRNQHERKQAAHVEQRTPHRVLEPVVLHLALDQVRDDLRVRLGDEDVPFLLQLALQIEVVLDDPVVDDDDPAGAVAMRVRVLLGRPSVRRPARVADAVLAVHGVHRDRLLQPRELARASSKLDRAVADDRNARRIVAAVLQPPQPVDQDRHDLLVPDVSDDAAHSVSLASVLTGFAGLFVPLDPAGLVDLLAARDAERACGHVLGDRRARRDVRTASDARPARSAASRCR